MAAIDAFEWFVSTAIREPTPEIRQEIRNQREYLLSLRSEDERQRFVESVISRLGRR
jgi:hypothetical protein